MSDKDRRKKHGERTDHKNKGMREDVKRRHDEGQGGELRSKEQGRHTDQGDDHPKPNPHMGGAHDNR